MAGVALWSPFMLRGSANDHRGDGEIRGAVHGGDLDAKLIVSHARGKPLVTNSLLWRSSVARRQPLPCAEMRKGSVGILAVAEGERHFVIAVVQSDAQPSPLPRDEVAVQQIVTAPITGLQPPSLPEESRVGRLQLHGQISGRAIGRCPEGDLIYDTRRIAQSDEPNNPRAARRSKTDLIRRFLIVGLAGGREEGHAVISAGFMPTNIRIRVWLCHGNPMAPGIYWRNRFSARRQ